MLTAGGTFAALTVNVTPVEVDIAPALSVALAVNVYEPAGADAQV
jgi:hypothetical protein